MGYVLGAVTALVIRCSAQDLAFQPMELRLPPALAALFDPSAGFGQALSGRVDAAGAKAQLGEEGQAVVQVTSGTGAPKGVQTPLHQRDALGQVSSRSRRPTLEAGFG